MTFPFLHPDFPEFPIILAPLAGVSDAPFRLACQRQGAALTYVEMLSATALVHHSKRTFDMMSARHPEETHLGVQITSRSPEEMGEAVKILDAHVDPVTGKRFSTIDINMGCPVRKVVKTGCGSGILKDLPRLARTIQAARKATQLPLSIKIRTGWDQHSKNFLEVLKIAENEGAEWITMHGRTRHDDYQVPVDLGEIAELKAHAKIPVIANGNIFSRKDAEYVLKKTGVDGVMVSRGALGNPWVFGGQDVALGPRAWLDTVVDHFENHKKLYGSQGLGAVLIRKHLLWYAKGWPGARERRDLMNQTTDIDAAIQVLRDFVEELPADQFRDTLMRQQSCEKSVGSASSKLGDWDPKWDMDRIHDRGVGG